MRLRVARYIGVGEGVVETGYRVFLDLLGHVVAKLGGDERDIVEILGRLGIAIPKDLLAIIARDVEDKIRILGSDEITRYQEIVASILAGAHGTSQPGSSPIYAARIASILASGLVSGGDLVLGDPFVGSGLVIRRIVDSLGSGRVSRVWGLGSNPLGSLAAYASLIDVLGPDRVSILARDPFDEIYRSFSSNDWQHYSSDVVLVNPVFLEGDRVLRERLPEIYRVLLLLGYGEYVIKRRLRLSTASILLADSVLKPGGVLIAFTPAYTLYRVSSAGVRIILRDRYSVVAIIEGPVTSFSSGGSLKEVVIAARKTRIAGWETVLIRIDSPSGIENVAKTLRGRGGEGVYVNRISLRSLWGSAQRSWIHFFQLGGYDERFVEILRDLMDSGRLAELRSVARDIVIKRGILIRAPRFFILPNRYWGIRYRDRSSTVIFNREDLSELEISNENLLPIIRRSKKRRGPYGLRLVESPEQYILSIPPKSLGRIDRDIVRYIEWGLGSRVVEGVVRIYGDKWYSYAYKEINARRPIADLFVSRAVWKSTKMHGANALMVDKPALAGDSFFAVIGGEKGLRCFLTLWFNSTFFLYMFSRIGGILDHRWGMISSDDFLSLPAPRIIGKDIYRYAEEIISKYGSQQLPPLSTQLSEGNRVRDEIDSLVSWLLGLGDEEIRGMRRGLLEILP